MKVHVPSVKIKDLPRDQQLLIQDICGKWNITRAMSLKTVVKKLTPVDFSSDRLVIKVNALINLNSGALAKPSNPSELVNKFDNLTKLALKRAFDMHGKPCNQKDVKISVPTNTYYAIFQVQYDKIESDHDYNERQERIADFFKIVNDVLPTAQVVHNNFIEDEIRKLATKYEQDHRRDVERLRKMLKV